MKKKHSEVGWAIKGEAGFIWTSDLRGPFIAGGRAVAETERLSLKKLLEKIKVVKVRIEEV